MEMMIYNPIWQEDVALRDISIDCSYYSASLLKEECCELLPLHCSYSHLAPVLSQQGTSDARPHRLVIPFLAASTSRVWFVFLIMCQLQRARGGVVMREAFP